MVSNGFCRANRIQAHIMIMCVSENLNLNLNSYSVLSFSIPVHGHHLAVLCFEDQRYEPKRGVIAGIFPYSGLSSAGRYSFPSRIHLIIATIATIAIVLVILSSATPNAGVMPLYDR